MGGDFFCFSKSVSELSQVTSLSDFPVPATLERMVSRVRDRSAGADGRYVANK